jgi:Domain of unknown function (DUF1877)
MSMIGNFLAISQSELDTLYVNPESVPTLLFETKQSEIVDLDKAWHAIHFMLTKEQYGGEGPLAQVIMGGVPIGEEDVGYGPARGMPVTEVQKVAAALIGVSESEFRARYDPTGLTAADIYPQIWEEGEDALNYITDNFLEVKSFYVDAAKKGLAVILFIG